jgi:hypothetical protein
MKKPCILGIHRLANFSPVCIVGALPNHSFFFLTRPEQADFLRKNRKGVPGGTRYKP